MIQGLSTSKRAVVLGGGKAGKKSARAPKKEVALECPAELITAFKDGSIYRMLESMNTNQIKLYCALCGVPRSGAKYKIQALLLAHVKKASFASCHDSNTESGALTLKFAQMSFARAHTKFCNLNTKLKRKGADARTRWETIVAAAAQTNASQTAMPTSVSASIPSSPHDPLYALRFGPVMAV